MTPVQGQQLLDVANSISALKRELYGKGPARAKTYVSDDFVFVVLDGGFTDSEETLLAAGEHQLVRTYRERFQEAVSDRFHAAVAQALDRQVVDYASQILIESKQTIEMFVLAPEQ